MDHHTKVMTLVRNFNLVPNIKEPSRLGWATRTAKQLDRDERELLEVIAIAEGCLREIQEVLRDREGQTS